MIWETFHLNETNGFEKLQDSEFEKYDLEIDETELETKPVVWCLSFNRAINY